MALALAAANFSARWPGRNPQFCADHICKSGGRCCRKCAAPAHGTPHFLYLHIEKTGGSAIECAWQRSADEGLVSLLGHNANGAARYCAMRCAARGVPTSRLLTVRQPHDYWASLFRYAWACITHEIDPTSCNSAESKALLADPASGVVLNATHSSRGVLGSFGAFMRYVRDSPLWANKSQAARIRRGCGVPCRYNELLRTERLASDWASLLQRHPGLPRVALPPVNVNTAAMEATRAHPWGRAPSVEWTPLLCSVVTALEAWVFDAFDYSVRCPSGDATAAGAGVGTSASAGHVGVDQLLAHREQASKPVAPSPRAAAASSPEPPSTSLAAASTEVARCMASLRGRFANGSASSLTRHLCDVYSAQLYGAPGRLPASELKVVWLPLLRGADLAQLQTCLGGPSEASPFYLPYSKRYNSPDSVWLQSRRQPRSGSGLAASLSSGLPAVPSHGWAEVTHCPSPAEDKRSRAMGTWFYHAPGAGLSLHVGRTRRIVSNLSAEESDMRFDSKLCKLHPALPSGSRMLRGRVRLAAADAQVPALQRAQGRDRPLQVARSQPDEPERYGVGRLDPLRPLPAPPRLSRRRAGAAPSARAQLPPGRVPASLWVREG